MALLQKKKKPSNSAKNKKSIEFEGITYLNADIG